MDEAVKRKIISWSLIGVGAIFVISTLWFVATHGIVSISKADKGGEYLLSKVGERAVINASNANWKIVPSGTYTASYTGSDARTIKNFDVPNFMQVTKVTFGKAEQKRVERVAAGSLNQLIRGSDGRIYSTNITGQTGSLMAHAANDPTGLSAEVRELPPSLFQEVINNKLVFFTGKTNSGEYLSPAVYDAASGRVALIPGEEFTGESLAGIIRPSVPNTDTFGVYALDGNNYALTVYSGMKVITRYAGLSGVANGYGDGSPKLIGVTDKYTAIGYGDDFSGALADIVGTGTNGNGTAKATKDFTVKVYDNSSKKEVSAVNIGKTNAVSTLQISGNGKSLAVVDNNVLKVIDASSSKVLYRYTMAGITSMAWLDNQRLLFGSTVNGIYELNVQQKSATTLFAPDTVRVNTINITGNQLLVTGFSQSGGSGSAVPDGYAVYLDQKTDNGNALIRKLPYSGDTFKAASLNGTIYAASTSREPIVRVDRNGDPIGPEFTPISDADNALKNAVEQYLKENIPNYQQYRIVYGFNL